MRQRRRIAALILAALLLIVLTTCTAGLVRLVGGGADAAPTATPDRTRRADAAVLTLPTTSPDAPGLDQLPEGDELVEGEVLGIDVSGYQGTIDWEKVRGDGVSFAYIKATEGVGHEDARFDANWKGAEQAGVARGAYHYFTLCSSGEEQALAFLTAVPPRDDALPPAVDLELDGSCAQEPDAQTVQREMDIFVAAVEKGWGRRVVVYSSWEWRDAYPLPEEVARPQWHTRDSRRPETGWDIWQVRFDARIAGIDGDVDLDVMKVEDLRAASALTR